MSGFVNDEEYYAYEARQPIYEMGQIIGYSYPNGSMKFAGFDYEEDEDACWNDNEYEEEEDEWE
jgi:hypothetical protein